ncbi:hypothetical protein [Paenibacillus bouchesdurhonensis]|uniref:hypothetical protein n=1 Tax=Paenibacillus bouchesdurhonensis TaxID=1870990 RepID=UPI001900B7B7|nr:hypothetical protein [Paenibacillus bouchesdurhonensis]
MHPQITSAADSDQDTLVYNLDDSFASVIDSVYTIESHLSTPGNMVIFEGGEINKLPLYKSIFQPMNIPLFLEDDEFKEINSDAVSNEQDATINGEKNIIVPTKTTLIVLYNANGKITVLQNDESIDESASKIKSFKSFVNTNGQQKLINDFKDDMNSLFSKNSISPASYSIAATQGDILTSIRKTLSVNGSYTVVGGSTVSYVAGKAVTDYILYANSKGTHFYVLADSQIYPAGVADNNNATWTTGYKSNIRTNSSTNSLINWSPNTTGLSLDSNDQFQVGISASTTGIELSFSYTWNGTSNVKLESTGSKTSGLTTEYIYKNNGNAIASSTFTTGHGALIQATNKVLSFSASHQFRNENVYSNGSTWYSTNTTNLSYSF